MELLLNRLDNHLYISILVLLPYHSSSEDYMLVVIIFYHSIFHECILKEFPSDCYAIIHILSLARRMKNVGDRDRSRELLLIEIWIEAFSIGYLELI